MLFSAAKTCKACQRDLPRTEFWKNAKQKDGVQSQCKDCMYDRQREFRRTPEGKAQQKKQNASAASRASRIRYASSEKGENVRLRTHKKHVAKIRREAQNLVRRAKDVPGMDCGKRFHFAAMDFDHVRGEKAGNVATLTSQTYSITAIQAEISKCEVVCSNCHRVRTYLRKTAKSPKSA